MNDDFLRSLGLDKANIEDVADIFKIPWKFGEFFFSNLDGSPRRYWDHQKIELEDCHPKIIHRDANEVGKTINITTRILHFGATAIGKVGLCVAPLTGQLKLIIDEIEYQLNKNDHLKLFLDSEKPRTKQPYYTIRFAGGSSVVFCPTGLDGAAYDGIHAHQVWADQACAITQAAWTTLFQRMLAEAKICIYSYHDGRRNTRYHELQAEAVPNPTLPSQWKLYNWPMSILPYPRWSKERELEKIKIHSGKDTSAYQRLVEGKIGKPTHSAFDVNSFWSCQKDIQNYEIIIITNEDFEGCETEDEIDEAVGQLISCIGSPAGPGESIWGGADLGYTSDPAEILIDRESQGILYSEKRIHLERIPYTTQAKIIAELDRNYGFSGFGVDRGGNGMSVMQMLHNNREFSDLFDRSSRFSGFDFGASIVVSRDDSGKEEKQNVKEFATSLINALLRRKKWVVPKSDEELQEQIVSHSYVRSERRIVFSKGNDHIIDGKRLQVLVMEYVKRLRDISEGGFVEGECASAQVTNRSFS